MTRTGRSSGTLVKSAMLWLTVCIMLASVFGALLTRPDPRPQLHFAPSQPAPIMTASAVFGAKNAER
ncbi:hypothetical protein [Maricaulis sp.]|uniref:hypothetical protein n=1 Tax=Maricaulis sp. TaxID=1486257 RepID=UPI003A8DF7F0